MIDQEEDYEDKFVETTALRKIRGMTARKRVIQGGSSSSKTFSILPILINTALSEPYTSISVVSMSVPHLKRGAVRDFKKIMQMLHLWDGNLWNGTDMIYTFPNGAYIEFFGADVESKVRGPRRKYLFVNECNLVPYETYRQLEIRTEKTIWMDFNPVAMFWAHTEVLTAPKSELIILTYKDNEGLSQTIVEELEASRAKADSGDPWWINYCRVYLDGLVGALEGAIYSNWNVMNKLPPDATLMGIGVDFGFSNSKTAIVARYSWNGKRIFKELCYKRKMHNQEIFNVIRKFLGPAYFTTLVVADCAEPKSISELRRLGLKAIRKSQKGKDSVLYGIQQMQKSPFYVTSDSKNMITELQNYIWMETEDTKGQMVSVNKPRKEFDDLLDAARYIETGLMPKKRLVRFMR